MPERPFGGGGVPPEGVYTLPSLAKRGGELRDHSFPAPLCRRGGSPHETKGTTDYGDHGACSAALGRGGAGKRGNGHLRARRPRGHGQRRRDPRQWGGRLRLWSSSP